MPKRVDHEARRWEISGVAAQLIAEGGLEAATIREIAQASGYSKGVVEHYFNGKDELISGALDWANRSYQQRVDRVTRGLAGMASLDRRIQAILPLDRAVRNEWQVRLVFWSMAAIDESLRKRQEQRFDLAVGHFENDLREAIGRGELQAGADVTLWARRLLNLTAGISIAALHNRRLYTRAFLLQEAAGVLGLVRAGEVVTAPDGLQREGTG